MHTQTDLTELFITIQWRNESYTFTVSNWKPPNQPTAECWWQANWVVCSKQTSNDHNPLIRFLSVIIFSLNLFPWLCVCCVVCGFTIEIKSVGSVWCLKLPFSVSLCIILISNRFDVIGISGKITSLVKKK